MLSCPLPGAPTSYTVCFNITHKTRGCLGAAAAWNPMRAAPSYFLPPTARPALACSSSLLSFFVCVCDDKLEAAFSGGEVSAQKPHQTQVSTSSSPSSSVARREPEPAGPYPTLSNTNIVPSGGGETGSHRSHANKPRCLLPPFLI